MKPGNARVVDPMTQMELTVPAGFSSEDVIQRAQRERNGELLYLRLLPEHGVSWPIWQRGEGLLAEESLPLSTALNERLHSWAEFWEAHLGLNGKWSSVEDENMWLQQARDLEDALECELWEIAVIERVYRS